MSDEQISVQELAEDCTECNGKGWEKKYPNNPNSGFVVKCYECNGTGKKTIKENSDGRQA